MAIAHTLELPGDTFTFRFAGALVEFPMYLGIHISVYGIFSSIHLGALSATYTVDGTTTATYNIHQFT